MLEALKQSELGDNWDDIGRRKDRFVRSSADKASGMTALMQEITVELRENRKERERLLKRIDGHRHASESVARTNRESAKPTRYSDQPAGWHDVRDWQATPVTSPVPQQAQPFFSAAQPLLLQRGLCNNIMLFYPR